MNCEEAYAYLTTLPHAEATFPFDDVSLVMKVGGKMFALLPLDAPDGITLKCDPEKAIELRERYASVKPAWHFNKKHWNTVFFEPPVLTDDQIRQLIDHSYRLVVAKLPKAVRSRLCDLEIV